MKLFDLEKNDRFLTDFSQQTSEPGQTGPASSDDTAPQAGDPAAGEQGAPPRTFEFGGAGGAQDPSPRPRRRHRRWVWWTIAILLGVTAACVWIRWFNPYAEDSRIKGYVLRVEKRGVIFKTYEGEIISESSVADRSFKTDLRLSVPDDSLGRVLQSYQGSGIPVELVTERYYATLPWRGEEKTVLTAVYPAR